MRLLIASVLCCVIVAASGVWIAAVQAPAGQTEFAPADQFPPTEQLPAAPLLVAAYSFVWLAAMVYVWSIWRRLGRVEREMQQLERRRPQRGSGS